MKNTKYYGAMLGFLLFSTASKAAMTPAAPMYPEAATTNSPAPAMPTPRSADLKTQLQESMQFCKTKMQEITQRIEELKREYNYYQDTLKRNKKGKF